VREDEESSRGSSLSLDARSDEGAEASPARAVEELHMPLIGELRKALEVTTFVTLSHRAR